MSNEGKKTSEFTITKETGMMAWVGTIAGIVMSIVPVIAQNFTPGSREAMYAGAALIVSSQIAKLLNSLGYQKSRTKVKEAEAAKTVSVGDVTVPANE